jgi:hypothetical protein
MCRIAQDVKIHWFFLVNRNTLGSYIFVGCHRMSENSGVELYMSLSTRNTIALCLSQWKVKWNQVVVSLKAEAHVQTDNHYNQKDVTTQTDQHSG